MTDKPQKQNITGWLVVDKPPTMGSTQVVTALKKIFHPTKIGHAGTLDPLATGVLPIAFGQATRTIEFVMNGLKTYAFTVRFGARTTTDDLEGAVVATSPNRPTRDQILAALPAFIGAIQQTPSAYSAIKINGRRAYDLARKGQEVDMPIRTVQVESLRLLSMPNADEASFEIVCGKGTYVRSIGRDLAIKLGTQGHLSSLRRTKCGPFTEKDSKTLEKIKECAYSPLSEVKFIPMTAVLTDILELAVSESEASALRHGRMIAVDVAKDGFFKAIHQSELIAFVTVEEGFARPTKVFDKGENDVD